MPDNGEGGAQQGAEQQNQNGQQQAADPPATGDDVLGDAGKQAIDRMKADKVAAERRSKALERELEQVRQATMSETEKAIAEAEKRGRTAASTDFGKRLVKADIATAAARRNPDYDTAALDYLDLSRFIGDDGEPDATAIAAAVERLVPAASGAPSFDGGVRKTPAAKVDMNSVIRKAAGLG